MNDQTPPDKSLSAAFRFAVRKATTADIDHIVFIEKNGFSAAAWPKEALAAEMSDPRTFTLLATADGQPAGYVMAQKQSLRLGEIFSLAVHSDFRRQGLGKTLLDAACADLRARGALKINLEVRTDNDGAIRLYEQTGFTIARTLPHYYEDGADAYLMTMKCKKP